MVTIPNFKRGDTFSLVCIRKVNAVPTSVDLLTISAKIRHPNGTLIDTLAVTKSNQNVEPGKFFVKSSAATTAWPVCGARCDIEFTDPDGTIRSTDTILVPIVEDITHAEPV